MELQIVVGNLFCYECTKTFSNSDSFKNHQHRHHQTKDNNEEDDQVDSDDSYSPTKQKYGNCPKKRKKVQPSKKEKARTKYQDENLGRKSPAVKKEKVESTSTLTSTSVLRPPLKSINVQKYKDYIHCYKCFSTFYHLDDLALHFDKCSSVPPSNSSFTDFKSNQGDKAATNKNLSQSSSPKKQAKKGQVKEIVSKVSSSSKIKSKSKQKLTKARQKASESDSQQEEQNSSSILSPSFSVSSTDQQKHPVKSEPSDETSVPDIVDDFDLEDQDLTYSPIGNDADYQPDEQEEEVEDDQIIQESESKPKKEKRAKNRSSSSKLREKYKCDICSKVFPFKSKLERHLSVHDRNFPCPVISCSFSTAQEKLLWNHVKISHPLEYEQKYARKFPCSESNCTMTFPCENMLQRHVSIHTDASRQPCLCPHCGKTLASQRSLQQHMVTHQENRERRFKCDFADCGKTFFFQKDLDLHTMNHDVEKKIPCTEPDCTRTFSKAYKLREHLNVVHLRIKSFKCEQCEEMFVSRTQQWRHFKNKHLEHKYKCDVKNCGKVYLTEEKLRHHSLNGPHGEAEKRFKCPIEGCSLQFGRSKKLDHHVKVVHEGVKEHLCSTCGKSFGHRSTYLLHQRTHTKEKPYMCSVCGWAFTNGTMLKVHMMRHTGERPLKCSYCDKTFRVNVALARHEQTHTGKLPYTCKFCDMAFPDNRPLKKHVQNVHSGDCEFDLGNPISYQSTPGHSSSGKA